MHQGVVSSESIYTFVVDSLSLDMWEIDILTNEIGKQKCKCRIR